MPKQKSDHETNALSWKVFFWITAVLATLGVLGISYVENLHLFDYVDVIFSLISTAGLYGFAYYKPIGSVIFWRYFFYALFIESIILLGLFPVLGIPIYGQKMGFDQQLLINLIYMASILYAIHHYAYRKPFIWQKSL